MRKTIHFVDARPDDVDYIMRLERAPENCGYISQWSREQHLAGMQAADKKYYLLVDSDERLVGFLLLLLFGQENQNVLIKRCVIVPKSSGYGHATLQTLKKQLFTEWQTHRLCLECKAHNTRARHLCETEGFTCEGLMREVMREPDGRFISMYIYSILRWEYTGRIG